MEYIQGHAFGVLLLGDHGARGELKTRVQPGLPGGGAGQLCRVFLLAGGRQGQIWLNLSQRPQRCPSYPKTLDLLKVAFRCLATWVWSGGLIRPSSGRQIWWSWRTWRPRSCCSPPKAWRPGHTSRDPTGLSSPRTRSWPWLDDAEEDDRGPNPAWNTDQAIFPPVIRKQATSIMLCSQKLSRPYSAAACKVKVRTVVEAGRRERRERRIRDYEREHS